MADWESCANRDECINGNRFGKGCVEDTVQSAAGGRPWHECYCGVDNNGNPPNSRQADEIERLRRNLKAELSDHINGTPCAQIRWQQERETLEQEIEQLKEELDKYENGYKGSCYACEPCGERNLELLSILKEIVSQVDQGGDYGKVFARDHCITRARAALKGDE